MLGEAIMGLSFNFWPSYKTFGSTWIKVRNFNTFTSYNRKGPLASCGKKLLIRPPFTGSLD